MSEKKGQKDELVRPEDGRLFLRVTAILDQARGNVARSVNANMVSAYWLIGREIVQELQGGDERAAYGKQVVENLSGRLTERYGKGFSTTNLWYFRQFYQSFVSRRAILHLPGGESGSSEILHPPGGELTAVTKGKHVGDEPHPSFSPHLSWSHYRALDAGFGHRRP